jgi:hypothetical protein
MDEADLKNIERMFKHQIGILDEDFQHKLDIVVEGHQMLAERIENSRVEIKEEIQKVGYRLTIVEGNLSRKIEAISNDFAAHRADKEIHRTGYGISENKE